jgi:hypothetical protein
MRLTDLEPQFLRYDQRDGGKFLVPVATLAEAHGLKFLCPKCFAANGGPVGTHQVICWSRSRGTPDDAQPLPGRWAMEGTGFGDLTLNADPPSGARSVLLLGGCEWHGFITAGEVT